MRNLVAILLSVAVLMSLAVSPALANDPKDVRKSYEQQVTFDGTEYLNDSATSMECHWVYNADDNEWHSGANVYQATVKGTTVSVTYDGKNMSWQPDLTIGTEKIKPATEHAILLLNDPVNENYHDNTLQWAYPEGITRNLRIIEGMLIEYYTIPSLPTGNIKIEPHIARDFDFIWTRPSSAWDADYEPVALTEDTNGVLILTTDSLKDAKFPVTVDPDSTFISMSDDKYHLKSEYEAGVDVWDECHDATTPTETNSTSVSAGARITASNLGDGINYFVKIYRGVLYFDTSSLPDSCTISSATLQLYVISNYTELHSTDIILQATDGDYDHTGWSNDYGQLNSSSITTGQYNTWTLTSAGKSAINKTGTTTIGIREEYHDEDDNPPSGTYTNAYNGIWFYAYEKGEGYWPQLVVTYTAVTPTINAGAASNVAQTTARLNSTLTDDGGEACEVRWGYGTTSQTAGDFVNYDTVTSWSGAYTTGQHPYYDASSLVPSTTYYYRVQARNSAGTATSGEITFTTEAGVADPTDLRAFPQATSVSLTWVKGAGSTNSLVRYGTDTYPTSITEGFQVYLGTSSSTTHTGLTAGTTYYYSVWGESGGTYSSSYATAMTTTSAMGVAGEDLPTPGTPTRWLSAPDYTNLSNLLVLYDAVNDTADSLGMPKGTLWMVLALLFATGFGIAVYVVSGHKMLVGAIALVAALVFGWAIQIVPFWIPLLAIILVAGIKISHREVEY